MRQKVLVIDDSPAIHALVRARLAGEPVDVYFAGDGDAGVALAHELNPDAILLDVDMPGSDGFDVCRRLKSDEATIGIPVVFLTGAATTEQKIRGLELGAVDYVTKPFDPAELRARVRASLRTKHLMDLLARKARIDGLTALWNRAYLNDRLASELSLSRRTGLPLSCILADVDRFKSINDGYGHPFGDEVLRRIAETLRAGCRTEDVVCRYGGEEFAVLAPNTTAAELAERLRAAVALLAFAPKGSPVAVTSSFGVAESAADDPASLVRRADEALYTAKQTGRNRVCSAPHPDAEGLNAGESSPATRRRSA